MHFLFFPVTLILIRWNDAVSGFIPAITIHHINGYSGGSIPYSTTWRGRQQIRIWYSSENDTNDIVSAMNTTTGAVIEGDFNSESKAATVPTILDTIISPVLRLVYPDLVEYVKQYGHPNIPLGNEAGRQCATLRRLRVQEKFVDSDIAILDIINFTWHSLEDVYTQQKEYFNDFIRRLKTFRAENDGDISPPKKYVKDPELGAWVTAVRRLHTVDEVDPEHVQILNELGFQWESPRKCGSKFMQQYRMIQERVESVHGDETARQRILNEPDNKTWIMAQQGANLSETRKHYMSRMVGVEWMDFGKTIT